MTTERTTEKIKVTATLDVDLVKWIDDQVLSYRFASRSHALEYAVAKLKESEG
jgi:Arc/MetJ-type ribon-helix-helix transcriptional regulator